MKECEICLQKFPSNQMEQITNCNHRFCRNCCISHIKTRSQNFSEVRCPQQNCSGMILSLEKLPISIQNSLTTTTIHQLQGYSDYRKLQQNPHLKPCMIPNCKGFIDLRDNKKLCSICNQPHCPKCLKAFHNGACILDEHDQNMRSQNYQKCPNCSIWVERVAGCMYIDCKCGTAFCHVCGIRFEEDPCRMSSKWKNQMQIQKLIRTLKYELPLEKSYYIILPAKILLQFILFLLLTIVGSVGFLISLLLGLAILILISPVIALGLSLSSKGVKKIFFLLIFPILAVCLMAFFIVSLILYPIFRKRYHHGVYDGLDSYITKATILYLTLLGKILHW